MEQDQPQAAKEALEQKLRRTAELAVHNKMPGAHVHWDRFVEEGRHPITFESWEIGTVSKFGNIDWNDDIVDDARTATRVRREVEIAVRAMVPGAEVDWDNRIGGTTLVEGGDTLSFNVIKYAGVGVGRVYSNGEITWNDSSIRIAKGERPEMFPPEFGPGKVELSDSPAIRPELDPQAAVTVVMTRADAMYWLAFADEKLDETNVKERQQMQNMLTHPVAEQSAMGRAYKRKIDRLRRLGMALDTAIGDEL